MKTKHFLKNGLRLLLVAVSLLTFWHTIQAQKISKKEAQRLRDSAINNSDYLFKVWKQYAFEFVGEDGNVYNLSRYGISEIIMGPETLMPGYIYVISRNYFKKFENGEFVDDKREIPIGFNGLGDGYLFCKKNSMSENAIKNKQNWNQDYIEFDFPETDPFFCETSSPFNYCIDEFSKVGKGPRYFFDNFGKRFNTKEKILEFLRTYGITPREKQDEGTNSGYRAEKSDRFSVASASVSAY